MYAPHFPTYLLSPPVVQPPLRLLPLSSRWWTTPGHSPPPMNLPPDPIPSHLLQASSPPLLPFPTISLAPIWLLVVFQTVSSKGEPIQHTQTIWWKQLPACLSSTSYFPNTWAFSLHPALYIPPLEPPAGHHQSGSNAGHLMETALLPFIEETLTARTASLSSAVLLLDL